MKRLAFLSIFSLAMMASVSAQSAEEVLNRHIEAVGGAEAWSNVTSTHAQISVSVEIPMGIIVLDVEAWNIYPGYMVASQSLVSGPEGLPDISNTVFVSPDMAWVQNAQGRQDITGNVEAAMGGNSPSTEHALDEIKLLGMLDTIEMTGQEEIGGKQANVLKVTDGATSSRRFYNAETGLLMGTEATTPMGLVKMMISEYQEVDGLKVPMIQEGDMGPQGKQTLAYTVYEINQELTPEQLAEIAEGLGK